MTERGENRCEYCLKLHEGGYMRWCSEKCAASWMHAFYWPAWHTVLAWVLENNPEADPRAISAKTHEQTAWIAGPPPTDCGQLIEYLPKKP